MSDPDDPRGQREPGAANRGPRIALLLVACWLLITAGIAFGLAEPTEAYQYLTVLVGLVCTRLWGPAASLPLEAELDVVDREDVGGERLGDLGL